jgi:hypothetical protein
MTKRHWHEHILHPHEDNSSHTHIEPQVTVQNDSNLDPDDPVDTVNEILFFASLAAKHKGTLNIDATGVLPEMVLEGHRYFFVA